jgi:Trypsin
MEWVRVEVRHYSSDRKSFDISLPIGDSGSGLFIKIGSAYYLRGIVSSSLFDENRNCDVQNYAVYTDVPKFLKWINNPNDPSSLLEVSQTSLVQTTESSQIFQQSCGNMAESSNLIQGGQKSPRSSFPWTVAIFVKENFDLYEHKAVGTLISNKHIVSLGNPVSYSNYANSLVPIDVDRLKMYFGVSALSESGISGALIIEGALKIILHPNIKTEVPRSSDMAVIFLQSPIFTTNLISPVCLWILENNFQEIVGKIGFAVGWGINEAGIFSEFKKQSPLKVQDQKVCRQSYVNYFKEDNTYFCAISIEKISTSCELDDPFYLKINGIWFLRGLINVFFFKTEDNKCSLTSPVLYEDIASYTNWIQSTIK